MSCLELPLSLFSLSLSLCFPIYVFHPPFKLFLYVHYTSFIQLFVSMLLSLTLSLFLSLSHFLPCLSISLPYILSCFCLRSLPHYLSLSSLSLYQIPPSFNVDGDAWRPQRKVASHMFSMKVLRDDVADMVRIPI